MALKVWDGFDHYNAEADFVARSGFLQYDWPGTAAITFAAPGRDGFGKCLSITSSSVQETYFTAVYRDRNQSAFTGMAVYLPSDGQTYCWNFYDSLGVTNQVSVIFRGDNQAIQAFRGNAFVGSTVIAPQDNSGAGVLLGSTSNNAYARGVWNFVEFWVNIDGSTGFVKVYVNSVLVLNITGVNTQKSANASWDINAIGGPGVTVDPVKFDDLYYCDTTSGPGVTPCNVPLGDCGVRTLFATGNDSVQFTPLANANWQEISEVAMDSDASYNFSTTPGNQDTFAFQPLANVITTIYGIQITYAARKDDVGARSMKSVVKISGTSYFGTTNSLPDTAYAYFTDLWVLNPNTTLNWVITDVNGATYGYNMVA